MKLFFVSKCFCLPYPCLKAVFTSYQALIVKTTLELWLALGLELGEVGRSSRHHQQIGNVNCSKMAIAKNAKQEILDDLALYEIMRF